MDSAILESHVAKDRFGKATRDISNVSVILDNYRKKGTGAVLLNQPLNPNNTTSTGAFLGAYYEPRN